MFGLLSKKDTRKELNESTPLKVHVYTSLNSIKETNNKNESLTTSLTSLKTPLKPTAVHTQELCSTSSQELYSVPGHNHDYQTWYTRCQKCRQGQGEEQTLTSTLFRLKQWLKESEYWPFNVLYLFISSCFPFLLIYSSEFVCLSLFTFLSFLQVYCWTPKPSGKSINLIVLFSVIVHMYIYYVISDKLSIIESYSIAMEIITLSLVFFHLVLFFFYVMVLFVL